MRYRILHKPSGLYYTPSRRVKNIAGKHCKSNLSKFGKIYRQYPSIGWTGFQIYTHLHKEDTDVFIEAGMRDWEVVKDGQPTKAAPTKLEDYVEQAIRKAIENGFQQKCGQRWSGIDPMIRTDLLNGFCEIYTVARAAEELARADFELGGAL